MGVRNLAFAALVGAAAVTMAPRASSAQTVTFSTNGTFGNGLCDPSFCFFGGYLLTFSGETNTTWNQLDNVTLGDFNVVCFFSCAGQNIVSGSTFLLTINQSGPNPGTGSISGLLGWDPTTSSLSWTPNSNSVTIGGTTYALDEGTTGCAYANTQCVNIDSPHTLNDPQSTDITDDIIPGAPGSPDTTTTPEPATIALMATGFVGMIPLARRRRRKN